MAAGFWLETTIAAELGEPPNDAARRLGIVGARQDIAGEVITMTEKDLAPVPEGFERRTTAGQFALDCAALERLGFLCDSSGVQTPADPTFRSALAAFQRSRAGALTLDGLIGPKSRSAILEALDGDDLSGPYLAALTAPKYSKHLDAAFFRGVRAMVESLRARGATATGEDFLAVWMVESGINPARANALGAPYLGLNQMGPVERRLVGFTGGPEAWLSLSAADQLVYVARWYAAKPAAAMRDAGSVYLINFLPAFAGEAGNPGFVLARRKFDAPAVNATEAEWIAYRKENAGDWYAWNRSLDRARKGWIEVADMKTAAEAGKHGDYWEEVRERYYAESGDSPPSIATTGGGLVAFLLVVGAVGGLAWWAST